MAETSNYNKVILYSYKRSKVIYHSYNKLDFYTLIIRLYEERYGDNSFNQTAFAGYVRISQSRMNKIMNGNIKNVDFGTLVRFCIILNLDRDKSEYLLKRKEKDFDPSNELHTLYLAIIDYCHYKFRKANNVLCVASAIDIANGMLKKRYYPTFHETFLY